MLTDEYPQCECQNCRDSYQKAFALKMAPSYEELEASLRALVDLVRRRTLEHLSVQPFPLYFNAPTSREIAAMLNIPSSIIDYLYPKET